LLHRLSGQTEVVIGLPVTTRGSLGSEQVVGHWVNFLPLRLRIDPGATFEQHLASTWQVYIIALENGNFTLGTLLRKLNRSRNEAHSAVPSVMFNLDWTADAELPMSGIRARIQPQQHCYARFDLSISIAEGSDGLKLHCQYGTAILDSETVSRWLKHFETLLSAIVANPRAALRDLPRLCLPGGGTEMRTPSKPSSQPQPSHPRADRERGKIPASPTEETVAQIFREIIGIKDVGRDDSFFDLGGHSLLATKVVSRIAKAFNVDLPLRTIFETPTIADLAHEISRAPRQNTAAAPSITHRSRESDRQKIMDKLKSLSEEELKELLRNPNKKNAL
jgi:acyl carrier protein